MRQLRSVRGAGWAAVELLSVPLVDELDESVLLAGAVACVLIALLGVVVAVLDCATAAPMTASKAAAAAAADNFFW